MSATKTAPRTRLSTAATGSSRPTSALSPLERRRLSTPRALALALGVVALAHIALGASVAGAASRSRAAIQTVGRDSVPSIVAALEVRQALARAHAAAADAWLAGGLEPRYAKTTAELDTAADRLVTAAQNITYGDEERAPIVAIAQGTRQYAETLTRARADGDVQELVLASRLLRERVAGNADALAAVNFRHLEIAYRRARDEGAATLVTVILTTALALGALVGLGLLLARRFHRVVSLPIAAAGVAVAVFAVTSIEQLERAREELRIAKSDAFDSLDAIARARAVLHEASGDQALALATGQGLATAFRTRASAIAEDPSEIDVAVARARKFSSVRGLLGDELRNITFRGEQEAAAEALAAFRDVLVLDARLREVKDHRSAIGLRLDDGGIVTAVTKADERLEEVETINRRELDAAIDRAFAALASLPLLAVLVPAASLGLSWLGVRPRLREYAV